MAVADIPVPRVVACLKQAWTNIWPAFWWLLLFTIIAGLAQTMTQGTRAVPSLTVAFSMISIGLIVTFLLGVPLSVGLTRAHLAVSQGEKPTWHHLGHAFANSTRYWQAVLAGVLSWLMVVVGLILLVLPGLYLAIRLSFVTVRFVADDRTAMDAIKASFADTSGHFWPLVGLVLLSILLVFAGLLALIVGVFVAAVLIGQWIVVYWRALQESSHAPPAPAAAQPVQG